MKKTPEYLQLMMRLNGSADFQQYLKLLQQEYLETSDLLVRQQDVNFQITQGKARCLKDQLDSFHSAREDFKRIQGLKPVPTTQTRKGVQ